MDLNLYAGNSRIAMILGALIGDAASLGLHWIYDSKRIAKIEKLTGVTFLNPDLKNYENTKSFFVHNKKTAGDLSSYGEAFLFLLKYYLKQKEVAPTDYLSAYKEYFGPGGNYVGYIDSTTSKLLIKLLTCKNRDDLAKVKGPTDDDQLTGLISVPILTALNQNSEKVLLEQITNLVRLTNDNEIAVISAKFIAVCLNKILEGSPIKDAITKSIHLLNTSLQTLIKESVNMPNHEIATTAEKFGAACPISQGLPLITYIATHTTSYKEAIEINIKASGDSCGRSLILGAIMAAYASQHQIQKENIPLQWLTKLKQLPTILEAILNSPKYIALS